MVTSTATVSSWLRRRVLALLRLSALVVAAAGAFVVHSAAPGSARAPGGVIAFANYRSPLNAVPGIYIVRPALGAPRPLRGRFFHGASPAWSPEGRSLAFER